MISYGIYQLFNLIMFLMLIKVLLSWFPNINWFKEPFHSLRKFTDIFFEPFRKIIPPVGMIDFSPIAAFLVLSILQNIVCRVLASFGL